MPPLKNLASALLLAASTTAHAADLGEAKGSITLPAPPTWGGFYVGANVGFVAAEDRLRLLPGGRWLEDTEAPFLAAQGSPRLRSSGIGGGIGAGFNLRLSRIVAGVEGDFTWTDLSARRAFGSLPPFEGTGDVYTFAAAAKSRWLSTVRGRLGLLADERTLVYATGGLAVADFTAINGYGNDLGPGLVSQYTPLRSAGRSSGINLGYAVGGGIEYALNERLTIKAEYLHADLGNGRSFTRGETLLGVPLANGFFVVNRGSLSEDIARVGLNVALP